MRQPAGVMASILTAATLTGTVVVGLVQYNSEHRDWAGIAAFDAAVTRESGAGNVREGHTDALGDLAIHPVIADGSLYPAPSGRSAELWSAFRRMVTPEFAADHVAAFVIAAAPQSPVVAVVERVAAQPASWRLTINIQDDVTRADYLRALIHEYAHLLTLGDEQLYQEPGECATTLLPEGCLLPNSTLRRFEERFWISNGLRTPTAQTASTALTWQVYSGRTDLFVTVYAATNLVEDAAESFAEFVLRDRPDAMSGVWAQKVLFYWDEPGYPAIRAHIRAWFGSELPRPTLPTTDAHRG